jgi:hypothetical protein
VIITDSTAPDGNRLNGSFSIWKSCVYFQVRPNLYFKNRFIY